MWHQVRLSARFTKPKNRWSPTRRCDESHSCLRLLRMTFPQQFAKFPRNPIAEEGFTRGSSSLQSALNPDAVSGAAAGVRAHEKQRVGAQCGRFRFRDAVAGWNWVART